MKTTVNMLTGKRFRYNEVVFYLGCYVPGRTTALTSTHLAPDRVEPKLFAKLNPGMTQPQREVKA